MLLGYVAKWEYQSIPIRLLACKFERFKQSASENEM